MTLDDMNILITFSKHPNYQQCAFICGVNRTTVSRIFQKIEKEYNVLLFVQTPNDIRFTEDGMKVIRTAYAISRLYDQMIEQVHQRDVKQRQIKIAIMSPLTPYNLTNSKRFQNTTKHFSISIAPYSTNQNILETGEFDFLYGIEGFDHPNYVFTELGRDDFITIYQNKQNDITYLSKDHAKFFHPLPKHFRLIDMDSYNLTMKYLLEGDNICLWSSESNLLHAPFNYCLVDNNIAVHRHFGIYHMQCNTDPYILDFIAHLKREDI